MDTPHLEFSSFPNSKLFSSPTMQVVTAVVCPDLLRLCHPEQAIKYERGVDCKQHEKRLLFALASNDCWRVELSSVS